MSFLFNLHLTTDNGKFIYYRLEVFREIELVIGSQEGKIHILTETLETMKNSEASTAIESGHIKETAIVEPGKYHLLVYFKYGITPFLFRCRTICREHIVINLILHFFSNLSKVRIESAFLPTLIYSSNNRASICIKSSLSIRISSSR